MNENKPDAGLDAGGVKRVRISIPAQDVQVLRWLARQSNASVSIRQVIREAVASYGYDDVTCMSVRGRGRPRTRDAYDEKYADDGVAAEPPTEDADPEEPVPAAPVAPAVPQGIPDDIASMLP